MKKKILKKLEKEINDLENENLERMIKIQELEKELKNNKKYINDYEKNKVETKKN